MCIRDRFKGLARDLTDGARPAHLVEHPIQHTIDHGNKYIDDTFEGEAILSVGKAIEFYYLNAAGVVNVMPFTCMPGTIVSGILKRMRKEHDQIPVISIAYDGQREASILNRLEAFVHQARQYQRRRSSVGVRASV